MIIAKHKHTWREQFDFNGKKIGKVCMRCGKNVRKTKL